MVRGSLEIDFYLGNVEKDRLLEGLKDDLLKFAETDGIFKVFDCETDNDLLLNGEKHKYY